MTNDLRCNYCHNLGHTKFNCLKIKDCAYCEKTGHSKEVCFKFKNDNGWRFGRGRGRYNQPDNRKDYRSGEHNADVIGEAPYTDDYVEHNDPLTGFDDNELGTNTMDGLDNTVTEKVLQSISEKT